ncbi:MAG TPA: hypothetical protein VNF05_05545 [Acidimicrobiales bacterium]|nr:hypothetical protein [Acidimicrobiales bacterium]
MGEEYLRDGATDRSSHLASTPRWHDRGWQRGQPLRLDADGPIAPTP